MHTHVYTTALSRARALWTDKDELWPAYSCSEGTLTLTHTHGPHTNTQTMCTSTWVAGRNKVALIWQGAGLIRMQVHRKWAGSRGRCVLRTLSMMYLKNIALEWLLRNLNTTTKENKPIPHIVMFPHMQLTGCLPTSNAKVNVPDYIQFTHYGFALQIIVCVKTL